MILPSKILLTSFLIYLTSLTLLADEILVSAPKDAEIFSSGTSLSILTSEQSHYSQQSLGEFLNEAAAVYVSRSYGLRENNVSLRGFAPSQVKILLDGSPLYEASHAADLSSIPMAVVDKVIIARGPQSSLYGSGAMGGGGEHNHQKKPKCSKTEC